MVLLARFPRYVWTSAESFSTDLEVANYGPGPLASAAAGWTIRDSAGKALAAGNLAPAAAAQGTLTQLGQVTAPLASAATPQKLSFEVALRDTAVAKRTGRCGCSRRRSRCRNRKGWSWPTSGPRI